MRLSGSSFAIVRSWRYQPMPVGKKPPAARLGAFSSTGPAMLQSWGRVTVFQAVSSKVGDWAPGASDWRKRQLVVNCWISRGWGCAAARNGARRRKVPRKIVRSMKLITTTANAEGAKVSLRTLRWLRHLGVVVGV